MDPLADALVAIELSRVFKVMINELFQEIEKDKRRMSGSFNFLPLFTLNPPSTILALILIYLGLDSSHSIRRDER
jgi:hypothetical protein